MSGESKTDYEAKVAAYNAAYYAAYNAGMRRAVESGFDTVAWKCRRPLKVTYPSPDLTPLCELSKESFDPECSFEQMFCVKSGKCKSFKMIQPTDPDGRPNGAARPDLSSDPCNEFYAARLQPKIYGHDGTKLGEAPAIDDECRPGYYYKNDDSSVPPLPPLSYYEPYAAEPPKGFFARYWLLIVVLVLVLVLVMLYLRHRKTARLV